MEDHGFSARVFAGGPALGAAIFAIDERLLHLKKVVLGDGEGEAAGERIQLRQFVLG